MVLHFIQERVFIDINELLTRAQLDLTNNSLRILSSIYNSERREK